MDENGKEKELELLASFSLDDVDYCLLEDEGTSFLFRYFTDNEDMVFVQVDDQEEFEEAMQTLEELQKERKEI